MFGIQGVIFSVSENLKFLPLREGQGPNELKFKHFHVNTSVCAKEIRPRTAHTNIVRSMILLFHPHLCFLYSVAHSDPDMPDPYNFSVSGSVTKIGLDPDLNERYGSGSNKNKYPEYKA